MDRRVKEGKRKRSLEPEEQVRQPVLATEHSSSVTRAKVKSLEALTAQLLCQVSVQESLK